MQHMASRAGAMDSRSSVDRVSGAAGPATDMAELHAEFVAEHIAEQVSDLPEHAADGVQEEVDRLRDSMDEESPDSSV